MPATVVHAYFAQDLNDILPKGKSINADDGFEGFGDE